MVIRRETGSPFFINIYLRLSTCMRTYLIQFFFVFTSFTTLAQTSERITEYFDKDWKTVSDKHLASYYRTIEYRDDVIMLRDYFISGKIQMVAECVEVDPKPIFDGKVTWYYESGGIKSEGTYKENEKVGTYKTYYENGSLEMEEMHFRKKGAKSKYIHFFSPSGVELLPNGKGVIQTSANKDGNSYNEVEDSVLVASFTVSKITNDTIFGVTENMAEYKGGLNGLAGYLQGAVKYPSQARRTGTQGTVYVCFTVDKQGAVKDSYVIKGISPECDAEALRVVSAMENWIPARHKSIPVKSRFVLPIKFKIGR